MDGKRFCVSCGKKGCKGDCVLGKQLLLFYCGNCGEYLYFADKKYIYEENFVAGYTCKNCGYDENY